MVPVRQAGNENSFEVGQDRVEMFGVFGRLGWKRRRDVTRLDARENRVPFRMLEIRRDPLDELVAVSSKRLRVHGRRLYSIA